MEDNSDLYKTSNEKEVTVYHIEQIMNRKLLYTI